MNLTQTPFFQLSSLYTIMPLLENASLQPVDKPLNNPSQCKNNVISFCPFHHEIKTIPYTFFFWKKGSFHLVGRTYHIFADEINYTILILCIKKKKKKLLR